MVGLSAYTHLFNRFIEHYLDHELFFVLAVDLWKACGHKVPAICAKCHTGDQLELSGDVRVVNGKVEIIKLDIQFCNNCAEHTTVLGVDCEQRR